MTKRGLFYKDEELSDSEELLSYESENNDDLYSVQWNGIVPFKKAKKKIKEDEIYEEWRDIAKFNTTMRRKKIDFLLSMYNKKEFSPYNYEVKKVWLKRIEESPIIYDREYVLLGPPGIGSFYIGEYQSHKQIQLERWSMELGMAMPL